MDLLAQMTTFVRVVDGQSLSAAARALRLSLPAVSRQLRALEDDLGTTLIVRSTRRLNITEAGRQWYAHCVRVLKDIEEARDDVRGTTRSARGRVVVSASLTFGSEFILPRLPELAEKHPHLFVDLRLEDQAVDLVSEGVDIAVRAGIAPPDSTGVVAHPLITMKRVLVASPTWLRQHGTPKRPADLSRHENLVQMTTSGILVRWTLLERGEPSGEVHDIEPRGRYRTNTPLALRDLALAGGGVAYLPDWLVADDITKGRLRRVLPGFSSGPLLAWAIHRAELRGAARIRAFLEILPSAPSRASMRDD